jgi:hypothetical protein
MTLVLPGLSLAIFRSCVMQHFPQSKCRAVRHQGADFRALILRSPLKTSDVFRAF